MSAALPRSAEDFGIGLVQMACSDVVSLNCDTAEAGVREAVSRSADIVCLQELFASRYFCQTEDAGYFDLAEEIPGPTTKRFSRLARELSVVIIVPVFERRAAGLYHNSAVVIDTTGELLGTYRKMHIPDDQQFFEKFYFTPGDLGYRVFDTQIARIGVLICWDQWYPEAARLMTLAGAEILFYPTAIGWIPEDRKNEGPAQYEAWRTIQRSHAIANGVYVAAVNRVGVEQTAGTNRDLQFWGRSFVSDPQGRVIAEADAEDAEVLVTRCSRETIEEQRRGWPFLRDRRIDTYAPIATRYLDGVSRNGNTPTQ